MTDQTESQRLKAEMDAARVAADAAWAAAREAARAEYKADAAYAAAWKAWEAERVARKAAGKE